MAKAAKKKAAAGKAKVYKVDCSVEGVIATFTDRTEAIQYKNAHKAQTGHETIVTSTQ